MLLDAFTSGSPLTRTARHLLLMSLVLLLASADRSLAQQITGSLYGKVTTSDGAPLPGVTVTITSPQLIKAAEIRITNASGEFLVPNLPPGTYSVLAALQGFTSQRRENIGLKAGASLGLDFQLAVAGRTESVDVVAEAPLVDVKSSQVTRTVGEEVIANAPIARRSFGQLLKTLPGVLDIEGGLFENSSVHGGGPRSNLQQIDGASANDPSDGSFMLEPPIDMLASVQVTTGGLAAEYGNASAAVFNYITKSGGNSFKGGVSSYYTGDSLQSDNLDDQLRKQIAQGSTIPKNLEYGGYLGGPIRKDRLWFFGNFRRLEEESQRPEFTARNQEKNQNQWFGKLTAQVTRKLRMQASVTHRFQSLFPHENSFQWAADPNTWFESRRNNRVYNLEGTQVLTDATFIEAQLSRTRWKLDRIHPSGDFPGYQDTISQVFYYGWDRDYGSYFDRDQMVAKANLTHYRGHHQFKTGAEWGYTPFYRETLRPGNFFGLLRNLQPFRVRIFNTPLEDKSNYARKAGYIQDQWTLGRVTLNLGLRAEATEGWLPAQCSGGANSAFPARTCFPEIRDVPNWFYLTPRVGVVWSVGKSARTAVKGSYGRYYQPITIATPEAANKNAQSSLEYDWIDANGDSRFQYGEQGTLRVTRLASQNFVDPDLRQPFVDTVYLGIERQLTKTLTVGLTGIYKKQRNIIDQISTNRPLSAYNAVSVTNRYTGQPLTVYALKPEFSSVTSILETTNVKELYEQYKGIEIVANKRMANRWQLQGSLNISRLKGNTGGSFADPNGRVFVEGPLDLDVPLQAKLIGSYQAPWGFLLSGYYQGQSGLPAAIPTTTTAGVPGATRVRFSAADNPAIVVESFIEVRAEPRGSQRLPFRNLFSLRAEKEFKLGKGTRLSAIADAVNLFNDNTVTGIQALLFDQANYLTPALIVNPRTFRLGFKFDF
jgi:hypothetical protein